MMIKTTTDGINLDPVDQLLKDYKKPEDILGENGILIAVFICVLPSSGLENDLEKPLHKSFSERGRKDSAIVDFRATC